MVQQKNPGAGHNQDQSLCFASKQKERKQESLVNLVKKPCYFPIDVALMPLYKLAQCVTASEIEKNAVLSGSERQLKKPNSTQKIDRICNLGLSM